jgi:capsule polysaccharide export protein KpsE/RkpR
MIDMTGRRVTLDLPRLVMAVWQRRTRLLVLHAVVAVVTIAVVLLMPRWFASSVTLVPAAGDGLSLDFSGITGGLPGASFSLGGAPTPQDQLKMVMMSRAVADSMVVRFDLVRRWQLRRRQQAREQLAEHTTLTTPREGQVVIAVEARSATLARDMAAAYAVFAASESSRLKTSLAAQRRRYLEARLTELESEITTAAARLRAFEETNGAVSLPDQAKETMAASAELQAQRALLETELAGARHYFTDQSPQVEVMHQRAAELDRQIDRLVRQGGSMRVKGAALPALKQQYLALTRELASLTAVSELLRRLYEQARVEEANPVASFSILDAAELPERHSRPKRGMTVALALTLCAAFSVGWTWWRENGHAAHLVPAAESPDALKEVA